MTSQYDAYELMLDKEGYMRARAGTRKYVNTYCVYTATVVM